ncbi:MAG: hypothetical protein PVH37_04095 [Desulfobacterales bacterium]
MALDRQDSISGYGLASMQEHAEIADGSPTIDSTPGEGTCVKMILPQESYGSIFGVKCRH